MSNESTACAATLRGLLLLCGVVVLELDACGGDRNRSQRPRFSDDVSHEEI